MKNLVLTVVVATLTFVQLAFTQDELHKGVYVLGGSASYSQSSNLPGSFYPDLTTFALQPQFSYFVSDEIMAGLGVTYLHQSGTQTLQLEGYTVGNMWQAGQRFQYTTSWDMITLGPTVRYYPSPESWHPFIGGTFEFSTPFKGGIQTTEIQMLGGADWFVARGVAIEPSISYLIGSYASRNFHTFQIGAGVSYFITPK